MDPVVLKIERPNSPFHLPRLPQISDRVSKIITAVAAIVICITMLSFVGYAFVTNSDGFKKAHHLDVSQAAAPAAPVSGSTQSQAARPGGTVAVGAGGTSGNNSPAVTLTATPSSVLLGGKSHLVWSATNSPTSCTASDDWNGPIAASGSADTQPLTKVQSYLFTVTCRNATGTGFSTVNVGATSQTSTGAASHPVVTLAAAPGQSTVYTGQTSTLIWSATSSPTSCSATGDWSGTKPGSGAELTAALSTARQYSFTLTCSNSAGTGSATASVIAKDPPPGMPVITIASSSLGTVTPGATPAITWSVTNNPTSCTASGDWSGAKAGSGSQVVGPLNTIRTYTFTLTCANATGPVNDSVPVQVLPLAPAVTLTVNPSTITLGGSSNISWSSTNSPTSCTASGDWSGAKAASGTQSTGVLSTVKTYTYSLSCVNAGGSGFANNVNVVVVSPPPPVVSLSIAPISVAVGGSATLTWSSTNSPTSCAATGSWGGPKAGSGSQSTGTLTTAGSYTYTLQCSNAGGFGSASTGITVSAAPAGSAPVVTISVNPTSIGTGSSSTINWNVTNSPTACTSSGSWNGSRAASGSTSTGVISSAGSYTYTLTCSNAAGSGAASATLTAIATPVVTISVNPASITAGASSTITWSVTASPSSCTAGGSWSGSKAASGTQVVTPAAGSYSYALSCTNAGGTSSNAAALTVNAPVTVYCSGNTPCLGVTDLSGHATAASCWGINLTWVIDITSYAPHHKGGTSAGSLATAGSTCNKDIHAILAGSASIPGFKDSNGSTTHGHAGSTINNGSGDPLTTYFVGYYDPTKP